MAANPCAFGFNYPIIPVYKQPFCDVTIKGEFLQLCNLHMPSETLKCN